MALTISKTYLVKTNLRIGIMVLDPNNVWKTNLMKKLKIEQLQLVCCFFNFLLRFKFTEVRNRYTQ